MITFNGGEHPRIALCMLCSLTILIRRHTIATPGKEDFYRSPDAEMSIMKPALLAHPILKERLSSEDIKEDLDDPRIIWADFLQAFKSNSIPNCVVTEGTNQ